MDPTIRQVSGRFATVTVFITVFIDLIGFGIVLPLLPSYASRLHATPSEIGALVASFSLMQFLVAPQWGRLSDRIGRRPVLLTGLAGSLLSYLLFAYSSTFWMLLVSRLVAGGMGATVNVAQAYLADVTSLEQRASAMGLIGAAFGLGFIFGPLIGGVSSRWGDHAPGLVAAGLAGANLVLAWFRLPETRIHTARKGTATVHWRLLVAPFLVLGFTTLGFTVMYVVLPLYAEHGLGYDRDHIAYLFAMVGSASAVVQGGLIGRLTRRWGDIRLIGVGGLLLTAGLAAVPFAQASLVPPGLRLPAFLCSILTLGVGAALVAPSVTGYVSRVTPPHEQGRALGALAGVGAVARIAGPTLAGAADQFFGARAAFLGAAAAAAIGVVVGLQMEHRTG